MSAITPIAWPFPADWSNGITERLSWLTAIQTSRSGAEQRQALRVGPRRQIDYPMWLDGVQRSYFHALMMRNLGVSWFVPLPHEEVFVGDVSSGQSTFTFDTSYRDLGVGSKLVVRGSNNYEAEVLQIASVTPDGITTTAGAVRDHVSAIVAPAIQAVVSEAVQSQRKTARVQSMTVRFTQTVREFKWVVPVDVLMHDGYPVLWQEPNGVEDLDYNFNRMLKAIDNDTSMPVYVDAAAQTFMSQKYSWFLTGRRELHDFRWLLYYMQGRCNPLWVPTFNDDLPSGGFGYPDPLFFGDLAPPPNLDGFVQFNKNPSGIDGPVNFFGTSPEPTGMPPDNRWDDSTLSAYRFSFLSFKRLDVDEIEIVHQGNSEGVTTVSAILRDAPDKRVPAGYVPIPFADAVLHTAHDGSIVPDNGVGTDQPLSGLVADHTITAVDTIDMSGP